MACVSSLAMVLSLAVSPGAPESSSIGIEQFQPRSIEVPAWTILAQRNRSERRDSGGSSEGHSHSSSGPIRIPSINIGPPSSDHHGGGIRITPIIPMPTEPPTYYPPYYPPYPPTYTPRPPRVTIPSNTVPTVPQQPVQPEVNVVMVEPEANDFTKDLEFRPITVKELGAFKDQITKKNEELADQLKDIFKGNPAALQAVDELLAAANAGKLDAGAIQDFVAKFGGGLNPQQQLQATGLVKQLVFNNIALAALLNVNINNLNINITNINLVNVNINVIGGGVWIGYWGFPWWPWNYPVWLGPGVWWGPCVYCPYPYYNPYLNGADALGVPYGIADPIPDYQGKLITSGILITNGGGATVNYTINGQRVSLKADYRQEISARRVVIAFDRGGSFGQAKYGIDEGWYKFTATDRGWELYKHTAKVTLDNTDNPFEFNYVLNNERQSLPAQYQREHTGKYPLMLRFDNGRGAVKQKVLEKGTFKVAVSGDGGLDVFLPENVSAPAPVAEMAKEFDTATQNIFAKPETIPNLFGKTGGATTPGTPDIPSPPTGPSPDVPNLFSSETG